MINKPDFDEQREFERQAAAGEMDLPQEVLKMFKLRRLIAKAWLPMGIDREEGADILIWAVGEDVHKLNFSLWPERIMENVGIKIEAKTDKVIDIMRRVAKVWQSKKVKPYHAGV